MPPSEGVALVVAKAVQTMESHAVWNRQRDLNFGGTVHCEEDEECFRRRTSRDPLSHRIIEKRRRDRMNSCLADLSRLIPVEYLKRGRGRVEKTEIIEMAIRHMRHLQESLPSHPTPPLSSSPTSTTSSSSPASTTSSSSPASTTSSSSPASTTSSSSSTAVNCRQDVCDAANDSGGSFGRFGSSPVMRGNLSGVAEQYRLGFLECLSETLHFLIEVEGFPPSGSLCLSLDAHLRAHYSAMLKGDKPPSPKAEFSLDGRFHFPAGLSQGKRGQLGFELPASEEESEPITHQAESQDYEEIEPTELKVVLTQNDHDCKSKNSDLSSRLISQESGASYKFKNNIKRRFTAGLEKRQKIEEGEKSGNRKCYRDTSVLLTHSAQCGLPSHAVYLQSDAGPDQTPHTQREDCSTPSRVPVFALHSERSFYVPLMLDPETLSPHVSLLSKQASALHPVTISVNFCNVGEEECDDGEKNDITLLPASMESPPSNASLPFLSLSANSHRNWKLL